MVAKGEDTAGELVSGKLKIKGCCIRGTLSYTADSCSIWYGDYVSPTAYPGLVLQIEDAGIDVEGQIVCASHYISWDYSIKAPGLHHVTDGSDVIVVKTEEAVGRYAAESHWLILRPAQAYPDAFERVGLLTLEVEHPRSQQPTDMARGIGVDHGEQTYGEDEMHRQIAWGQEQDMKRQLNMAHEAARDGVHDRLKMVQTEVNLHVSKDGQAEQCIGEAGTDQPLAYASASHSVC